MSTGLKFPYYLERFYSVKIEYRGTSHTGDTPLTNVFRSIRNDKIENRVSHTRQTPMTVAIKIIRIDHVLLAGVIVVAAMPA